MKPAMVGNAMVDGVAIGPEHERIAIEVKSPRDDIVRGIGQRFEALAAGYTPAVLVTTLRVARRSSAPPYLEKTRDSSASSSRAPLGVDMATRLSTPRWSLDLDDSG